MSDLESGSQDPFLWLEEVEGSRALDFVAAQNKITLDELAADPRFEVIEEAVLDVLNDEARLAYGKPRTGRGGTFVWNFWRDAAHVRGLWRRAPIAGYKAGTPQWETVLDVDALADAEGENWVWQGASVRPGDGERALVSLSRGGADASVVREFDIRTRSFVEGGFYLREAKSNVAWMGQNTLLVRTDFGEGTLTKSGYGRQAKLWQRGTPLEEASLVEQGIVDDVGLFVHSEYVGARHIGVINRWKTFFDFELAFLVEGKMHKAPLPSRFDFYGLHGDEALVLLRADWTVNGATHTSGTLVSFSLSGLMTDGAITRIATVLSPGSRTAIETGVLAKSGLYLVTLDNVIGKVSHFDFNDGVWSERVLDLPGKGAIGTLAASTGLDDVFISCENYLTPPTLYHVDAPGTCTVVASVPPRFDADGLEVWQFETQSLDGERIPYFVVAREDLVLDGSAPTLLNAYGGFQVARTPTYSAALGKSWLESGGVYVLANIRGGGEFGPRWHEAALKENRQKAFDDFAAVAKDLIARKITSPRYLGISGGSNGGLLVGAIMVQHPELFNAVLCDVPLLDMLRYNKLLAGASWVGEYGDPDVPDERAFIEKYSPYQNVKPGIDYPRTLFYTSTKDDRVHPGHARKMMARMKDQGHTPLYYENTEGGHGRGANMAQHAKHYALQYTFLWRQLGRN